MEYGLTNDPARYEAVLEFRSAAVADGWLMQPLYPSREPEERASRLTKEGFSLIVLSRVDLKDWKYEASVRVWGPDGLPIPTPATYAWAPIVAGLRCCHECGAQDVPTKRYLFAGRACAACAKSGDREPHRLAGAQDERSRA
jgi:hypothetical protein